MLDKYDIILVLRNGMLFFAKESTEQTIHAEFKKLVVKTMQKKLSYRETARQFEINDDKALSAA